MPAALVNRPSVAPVDRVGTTGTPGQIAAAAAWIEAVGKANVVNSKHMGEEERQGLTDFRRHAAIETRHALAVRFAAFEAEHITGIRPVNKDPEAYVEANG